MKISKNATIGSIIIGVLFVISGIIYLINLNEITAQYESINELCMILGITLIIWGAVIILIGFLQFREIKKGKEIEVPDQLLGDL